MSWSTFWERQRQKWAWNAYYRYAGEVCMLSPDYAHPGPHVTEPYFPDPRRPGREHECRNKNCSGLETDPRCNYKHRYPQPGLATSLKLLQSAPDIEHERRMAEKREQAARDREYELLGMKDTDELIARIDEELDTRTPAQKQLEHAQTYHQPGVIRACCINTGKPAPASEPEIIEERSLVGSVIYTSFVYPEYPTHQGCTCEH